MCNTIVSEGKIRGLNKNYTLGKSAPVILLFQWMGSIHHPFCILSKYQ